MQWFKDLKGTICFIEVNKNDMLLTVQPYTKGSKFKELYHRSLRCLLFFFGNCSKLYKIGRIARKIKFSSNVSNRRGFFFFFFLYNGSYEDAGVLPKIVTALLFSLFALILEFCTILCHWYAVKGAWNLGICFMWCQNY